MNHFQLILLFMAFLGKFWLFLSGPTDLYTLMIIGFIRLSGVVIQQICFLFFSFAGRLFCFCGSLFASVPAARVVTATARVGQGRACVYRSTRLHTVRTPM